jgi:uncharacterized membrane protein
MFVAMQVFGKKTAKLTALQLTVIVCIQVTKQSIEIIGIGARAFARHL